jgi:hypothetical protein
MKITATTAMGKKIVAVLESVDKNSKGTRRRNFRHVLELPDSPVLTGLQDLKHFRVFTNFSLAISGRGYAKRNCLTEVVGNPGYGALILQSGNVRATTREIHCPGFLSVKKPITPSETAMIKPAEDKQGRRVYNGFDFCDIDGWLEVGESFEGTGHFGTHIKGEVSFRVEFVDFVFFAVKQFN